MEVADIVSAVDIVEYISQYTDLQQKGEEWWGLSPFREENTPSFSVRKEKGYFYDFSAGFGGNILDFIMRHDKVPLAKAVRILKSYAHIEDDCSGNSVSRNLAATQIAKRYRKPQRINTKCTAKILPNDCMDRYEFRRDKLKAWADEGIQWNVMREWGVRYDAFYDRIVYPITDFDGNIFCISGRTCDPDYKKKGIRKYTYTSEIGALPTIYGFSNNREAILSAKEIILFEGAKSVLKMVGWGKFNCGALLTSHLSPIQFEFLVTIASYYGVRVVFALDSDVDILKDDHIKRLCSYARIEWVQNRDAILNDKESPVDRGLDVFNHLYDMRSKIN